MNLAKKLGYGIMASALICLSACDDKEKGPSGSNKPGLSALDQVVTESNGEQTINIKLQLSAPAASNVVISYSTKNGSAIAGSDYVGIANASVIITAGLTSIDVPIIIMGDKFTEPDETFELVITSALNSDLIKAKALITIKNDDTGGGSSIIIPSAGATSPSEYVGYNLVWADEFTGTAVNENNWSFEIGNNNGWGNNELEYYKKENSTIHENEYLIITAKPEQTGEFQYTSSRLISKGKKEFTFGRVDIRAVMPIGQGIWPALWTLGADIGTNSWPACGEIDIMEYLGHEPDRVHGTAHWGTNTSTHKYKGSSTLATNAGDFNENFHVFSILWEKDKIEWRVDDKKFYEITAAEMEGQPYPFNKPQFFLMNLAVGGNWPGYPDATTVFPQLFIVDYIRVFQKS
ncbi:MAG: family 16 glycosylhydrolase [Saprospiraceae bacterium]|nr:family 16 glycosylhydrolase [Candidatus Brachybacter algidus]MBK8747118.1 family 16 glycosylhydrolase [Candidatus Brachybacter algidus]